MQLLPIKIILDLHPSKFEVCAIKPFYSRRLSRFLYHCSHSNLTLGSDTSCRELTRNSQPMRNKNKENTCQRKTITCTRQYLRGSAICLRPQSCRDFTIIKEKNTKCGNTIFLSQKTTITNPNHQNCVFYILRIGFTMGYKMGQKNFPKPQKISH